jgi:hypothetical protein
LRKRFKSPIELQQYIEEHYGPNPAATMTEQEAKDLYNGAIDWAVYNNVPAQDYFARKCGFILSHFGGQQRFIESVVEAMQEASAHFRKGKEMGLSGLEQRTVDTLWRFIPHPYHENYVACARELSKAITDLLPPMGTRATHKACQDYIYKVMQEAVKLTKKYDVEFDLTDFSLEWAYMIEWLPLEFGYLKR